LEAYIFTPTQMKVILPILVL